MSEREVSANSNDEEQDSDEGTICEGLKILTGASVSGSMGAEDEGEEDENRRSSELGKLPVFSKGSSSRSPRASHPQSANSNSLKNRNSIVRYISKARKQANQLQVHMQTVHRQNSTSSAGISKVIYLHRGGTYVQTSDGPVQIGLPPETIKDVMNLGLTLPRTYVLPKHRFNLEMGLNVAEFEFPAFYNFFLQRRRVNLVINKEVEPIIRTIFQETLLGPKTIEWPEEYSEDIPKEKYPDLKKEMSYFSKNPFNRSEELCVETLVEFTIFDENGVAKISDNVTVKNHGDSFSVLENDVEITRVASDIILINPNETADIKEEEAETKVTAEPAEKKEITEEEEKTTEPSEKSSMKFCSTECETPYFIPPYFGITMLGNSDGFDKTGTTTGFVLWMNRRGIMVDPPPHSGALLKKQGIHPRLIRGMILTHCHADHDAGAFQKILEEGRVVLFTTKIIYRSFLRKYSAISGLEQSFLEKLFIFRPVIVGERTCVYGGYLKFFYSLHSIPCVGFSASSGGKSMIYSADTFNDEEGIMKFYNEGYMNEERRDALINFPWHHDVILHEAGVPPIHTPFSTFEKLDEATKKRLYIVHKPAKDVPAGFQSALVGPENTIVISDEPPANAVSLEILDLVGSIELFSSFMINRALEMVQCASMIQFSKGDVLIEEGSIGTDLYVVSMGVIQVSCAGENVKQLTVGDMFGEMSIINSRRTATIKAKSDGAMIAFSKNDFMHLIRDTDTYSRIERLGHVQQSRNWQVMNENAVLSNLSSAQKSYLQSIFESKQMEAGDVLWEAGQPADVCVLIDTGKYGFARAEDLKPFACGAFVGEIMAIHDEQPYTTSLLCLEGGQVWFISRANIMKFLEDNPGFLLYFLTRKFVE